LYNANKGISSDEDVSIFGAKKLRIFSTFMVCSHGQGRGRDEPGRTFCRQRKSIFVTLCRNLSEWPFTNF